MKSLKNFYIDSSKGKPNGEVFHSVICIFALLEKKIAKYLSPYDLNAAKFNALMLLQHKGAPDGLSQNEISHHMIVSPSNITRLLDNLSEDKLIVRIGSTDDRRVNLIKITRKGSTLLDKVWDGYCGIIRETVTLLEEKEVKQLSGLLIKWFLRLEDIVE